MQFSEFARQRLFEPLGMKSSAYVTDILQGTGERATGYQKEGTGWKKYMRLGNERGGGAIISTAGDLLIWNEALANSRLGKPVTEKLEDPAMLKNGRKLSYARGLIVNNIPGGRMVSHSGGAAGYSTWLGRFTDHGLSVAVLCNFDPVSATALAGRVADLFLPPVDSQAKPPGPVAASGVEVTGRAGLYFNGLTGETLRLIVNNGRLTIPGAPPLVPVSADQFRPQRASLFFMSQDDFELTFRSNDEFELKSMEGKVTRYRRAQPYTPTVADLQALAGKYESDEIGAFFDISPGKDGLMGRANHASGEGFLFSPLNRDTFQLGGVTVRFRRDKDGKVVALDYSNPVVRSIKFTRLSDSTSRP